jgi:TPR repeat protein
LVRDSLGDPAPFPIGRVGASRRARGPRTFGVPRWILAGTVGTVFALGCSGEERRALPSQAARPVQGDAKQCDDGDMFACNNLAAAWEEGIDGVVDLERARALYERACDGGATLACVNLAQLLTASGDAHAQLRSVELLETACRALDRIACQALAEIWADPEHPRYNEHAALRLLSENCDAHVMRACVQLGEWHLSRPDVPTGAAEAEARALFERACSAGYPDGCAAFGASLRAATTLPRDEERGFALLERACFGDHIEACEWAAHPFDDAALAERFAERQARVRERGCDAGRASLCADAEPEVDPQIDAPPSP